MNIEDQLTEMNAAIADLVDSASTEQVAKVLGEILAVLKAKEPKVTVNVNPTPITNVVNVPPQAQCDYEFKFTYDGYGQITSSRMKRIQSK